MDPNDQAVIPANASTETPPDATAAAPSARTVGFRRTVLTAGMAAALLIAGGAAVVSAASPDPPTGPRSGATTTPSDGATGR